MSANELNGSPDTDLTGSEMFEGSHRSTKSSIHSGTSSSNVASSIAGGFDEKKLIAAFSTEKANNEGSSELPVTSKESSTSGICVANREELNEVPTSSFHVTGDPFREGNNCQMVSDYSHRITTTLLSLPLPPPSPECGHRPNPSQDVNVNCSTVVQGLGSSCAGVVEHEQLGGIAENEKHQIEMFFKSLKTEVFVCESLVNLYVACNEEQSNWTYRHTGIVVVILDCGDTKSRAKRKIQILLAERGTCFPLWKDTIDNLSSYHKSSTSSAFHVMHLSSDHRQIIGFSFDSPSEADKLLAHIEELTSNPENINISVPGSSKKKVKNLTKKKYFPLPHKKQISNPCLFQHVISVAAKDKPIYVSLQTLMNNVKNEEIPKHLMDD